jgi:hypothetical protein
MMTEIIQHTLNIFSLAPGHHQGIDNIFQLSFTTHPIEQGDDFIHQPSSAASLKDWGSPSCLIMTAGKLPGMPGLLYPTALSFAFSCFAYSPWRHVHPEISIFPLSFFEI